MRFKIGEWDVKRTWRFGLVALILLSCAGCDRATKNMAREWLAPSPPISVLNDLVRFEYVENPGAFLGLGSSMPGGVRFALLVVFAGASLLFTLVYIAAVHTLDFVPLIGLSLVAGGGVGNLIDRIINDGAVTDFVRLGIGPFQTGIFNLADVAIVVGVAMLLLWRARETRRTRKAAV